jgi:hypothetical protein
LKPFIDPLVYGKLVLSKENWFKDTSIF